MSLTQEQKQAFSIVEDVVKQHDDPMLSMVGMKILTEIKLQHTSAREMLEELGKQMEADHADGSHKGCDCRERHTFLMDVLAHLEKQSFNDNVIHENLATAVQAWMGFCEEFDKIPTVTYLHSQYVVETGVAGLYFIHPAAQR